MEEQVRTATTNFYNAVGTVQQHFKLNVTGECLRASAEDLLAANNALYAINGLPEDVDDERCAAMRLIEDQLSGNGIHLREMALAAA